MTDTGDTESPIFTGYSALSHLIADECPEITKAHTQLLATSRVFWNEILHASPDGDLSYTQQAQNLILNQMINDFFDLLYETASCRGRPAMRSARSIFEHYVNFCTVSNDPIEAERYVEHGPIVEEALLSLDIYKLNVMSPKSLQKWQRRANHQLKSVTSSVANLRAKYGSGYSRGWASLNLRDRAKAHGIVNEYNFYKIASAVMHGSAKGAIGTFMQIESGAMTHRAGPALELCPLAYAFGLSFVDEALGQLDQTPAVAEWRKLIVGLKADWERYAQTIASIEDSLLPSDEPLMVVARINTMLSVQWWMHDRERGRVAKIGEPDLPDTQKESLEGLLAQLKTSPADEAVTVGMLALRADIPLDSDWVAEASVLPTQPLYLDEPPFRPREINDWSEIV